jgi:hypothetical protein
MKYVGETGKDLRSRFYTHRSQMKKAAAGSFIYKHFQNGICKDYNVKIIEKLHDSGDEALDKSRRLKRESFWIRKLHTKFPFGLNDKLLQSDANAPVWSQFKTDHKQPRPSLHKRGLRKPRATLRQFWNNAVLECQQLNSTDNLTCSWFVRTFHNAPKHVLQRLCAVNFKLESIKYICCDLLDAKCLTVRPKKEFKPKFFMHFAHSVLDDVNIPAIFSLSFVKANWPYHKSTFFDLYRNPTTVFSYGPPLGTLFCNYRKFVENLDDFNDFNCECKSSPFINKDMGHICTGNLDIIEDDILRSLFQRGFNYKPRSKLKMTVIIDHFDEAINTYVNAICKRFKFDEMDLVPWVTVLQEEFKLRLDHYHRRQYPADPNIKDLYELRSLQKRFVIVPVDKASNNYAFICKNLYAALLQKELNGSAYVKISDNLDMVKDTILTFLSERNITPDSDRLPFMYLIPKFHKSPITFRPIISGKTCITKQLSRLVGFALQFIMNRVRRFDSNNKQYAFSANCCWIIDDNQPVLSWLRTINKYGKPLQIRTYDFENLYTTLPLDKVCRRIWYVIDKSFVEPYLFINVNKYHRYLSSTVDESYDYSFSKDVLKNCFKFLLHNAYFNVGNVIYRQAVGLPMGSDFSPHAANLYLYQQEAAYFVKNWSRLRHHNPGLINFHRLIDDITVYNDNGMFEKAFSTIYDTELTLKKVNDYCTKADILDVSVNYHDGATHTTLYDKRRKYDFRCIRFPHINSLISHSTKCNVMKGQLLRLARICSNRTDFQEQVKILYDDFRDRGYDDNTIFKSFKKMYNKHRTSFQSLINNAHELKSLAERA